MFPFLFQNNKQLNTPRTIYDYNDDYKYTNNNLSGVNPYVGNVKQLYQPNSFYERYMNPSSENVSRNQPQSNNTPWWSSFKRKKNNNRQSTTTNLSMDNMINMNKDNSFNFIVNT
jgi:hypothetical protein